MPSQSGTSNHCLSGFLWSSTAISEFMFKNCLECIVWNYSCLFYSGEWPTEDVRSDDSTEPYNVGPIEMVQRLYSNATTHAEQAFWRCRGSCIWFKTVIILVSRSSLGSMAVPEPVCVRKRSAQMPRLVTVSIKRDLKKYENSFYAVNNNFTLYALTNNINKLHSRRQCTELRMILSPTLGQIAFGDRNMKTDTY